MHKDELDLLLLLAEIVGDLNPKRARDIDRLLNAMRIASEAEVAAFEAVPQSEQIQIMDIPQLRAEQKRLQDIWVSRKDDEGHAGSPGEWIIEALCEVETRLQRLGEAP